MEPTSLNRLLFESPGEFSGSGDSAARLLNEMSGGGVGGWLATILELDAIQRCTIIVLHAASPAPSATNQ